MCLCFPGSKRQQRKSQILCSKVVNKQVVPPPNPPLKPLTKIVNGGEQHISLEQLWDLCRGRRRRPYEQGWSWNEGPTVSWQPVVLDPGFQEWPCPKGLLSFSLMLTFTTVNLFFDWMAQKWWEFDQGTFWTKRKRASLTCKMPFPKWWVPNQGLFMYHEISLSLFIFLCKLGCPNKSLSQVFYVTF